MPVRIPLVALALLALTPAAGAQILPPATGTASAQDCAVIAEVGKGKLDWGKTAPRMRMYAKSFGVDCDWKALGMAAPDLTNVEHPPLSFSLSRPAYAADGLHATVDYSDGGSTGPNQYFYEGFKCSLEKRAGKWNFRGCKFSFIT